PYEFKKEVDLPENFSYAGCVSWKDEILICGGYLNNACYSYNVKRQEYKKICHYPEGVKLFGHMVVAYGEGGEKVNGKESLKLLSLGGGDSFALGYHTLQMTYVSVWDNEEANKNYEGVNEWKALPNNQIFGKKNRDNLEGVRGVIGGEHNDLLFLTHRAKQIDVINLKSFEYVESPKNSYLPISSGFLCYHAFIAIRKTTFVLICEKEALQIQYDQLQNSFSYQNLPSCDSLKDVYNFGFINLLSDIFLFGGWNDSVPLGSVVFTLYIYHHEQKEWEQVKFPNMQSLSGSTGIFSNCDSAIHLLGGHVLHSPITSHFSLQGCVIKA
ncbi:hypothetical protein RFI_12854, partial [Reticulomyxa filosa]